MRIQEKTTEHLESVNIEIEVSASFKITSDAIYLSNYIDGYFKKTKDCNEKPARRERPNYKKSNFYRYLTVIHPNQMLCAINLNWD